MAYFYLCAFMHRIVIPIILSTCVVFRPCGLSGIYLIFLLYIPFVPVPTPKSLKGRTKWFIQIMMIISFLITISKLTFNVVLLTTGEEYGSWLPYCSTLERAFRTAGFVRLDSISVLDAMTWLSPDVVMLLTTFTYFLGVIKFAVRSTTVEAAEQGTALSEELINVGAPQMSIMTKKFLVSVGRYLSLSLLCLAAILRPSIPGGVYFITFLACATWWGCYKQLNRLFVYLTRGILVLLLVHIIALYVYQLQWLQELLSGDSRWARYFGLTPLLITDCKDPRTFTFVNAEWPSYVNPIVLTCLYHVIVVTSKNLLKVQDLKWPHEIKLLPATEYTPLIRGVSPSSRKYGAGPSLIAESTSRGGEAHDDIPMHPLGKGTAETEYSASLCEQILFCLASTFDLIVRSSYIATNIIMMVWSITYHSWLTFVLLLWANIMWMLPNQRRTMLRSTPILVFYAEFLLIAQYIFGMNLTDEELPAKVKGFDLAQFGFEKVTEMPCIPLLVKCLYTAMFWITLRQFMKERKEAKQTSTLADMVAPLQVTVSTATTAMGQEEEAKQNKTMERIGRFVKRTLTTYWICVVAIMLFVSGITGTHMTGFRIVYMALFLVFIIAFQLSWTMWRRMMYVFWAVVIIYSMVILILVYTYQFNNFDDYWVKYLHIPVQIQNDIGLEKYETKQLFVRLLTPTFFVIITVIQMHYFHQDFLALSDIRSRRRSSVPNIGAGAEARSDIRSDTSSAQMGLWEQKTQAEQKKLAEMATEAAAEKGSKTKGKKQSSFVNFLVLCWKHISYFFDLVWLFLELHLLKAVLLCGTFLCIFDPCAAHFPIMVMCAIVLACGSKAQNCIKHVVAIMCSVLLLFNMIYQIEYIKHERWNVHCSETNETKELNGAEWLGFKKTKFELPYQLRWYIVYLVAASAHVVVTMRQLLWRLSTGQRLARPYVMFPEITRNDADKNLLNCVKFLANYCFYKFGYEMTLITIVALVGIRMDFYALLYALWLIVFIRTTRKQAAVAWPFFIAFVIVILPIQYVMVIGLPPWLCITFPWEQQIKDLDIHELQNWLYLLNARDPPPANKLVCDVIVLMMAARQAVVFRIERRFDNVTDTGHGTSRYPGGANARLEQSDDIDQIQNPVSDFVTYIRSWLDIVKRGVFLSFLWVTLAVVFLAGTNRVNVFSIGYLVGSFIFLWLGSDLYLRPIPKIINYWNCLLCYNVFVIIVKVLLQIPGCIFLGIVQERACWAVQLFAIGCINKFADESSQRPANTYIEGPTCTVPHADVGLFWDGICFGFLILQKRLFNSYYFLHMIDDTKAITILASRGAELIEELRQQQIAEQQVEENNILEKIKAKMDRIKANQQRIQGPGYTESTNHFVDGVPLARSSSMSSSTSNGQTPPAGYHTPISEESPPPPIQAPTPCSALMTVSLDGYLEPQRMSFGSPPSSELIQTQPSLDESFPVFSPPPYGAVVAETAKAESKLRATHQRQASIGPPWMEGEFQTPRQSIISFSSRSPHSHQTYTIFAPDRPMYRKRQPRSYKEAIRSGDYYMFESYDDEEIDFEINQKGKEKPTEEEEMLTRRTQPVGEFLNSALKLDLNTVVKSHHQRRASMPGSTSQLKRQRSSTSSRSHLSDPLITHPPVPRQDFTRQPTDKLPTVPSGDILDLHKVPDDKTGDDKKGSGGGKRPARDDDDAMSTLSAITEPKSEEETWKSKLMTYLYFVWAFLESCMISFTIFLNKFSKDYRYVIRVLTKEKKYLKDKGTFRIGVRRGSGQVWHPIPATYQILKRRSMEQYSAEEQPSGDIGGRKMSTVSIASSDSDDVGRKPSVLTIPEIRLIAPSIERGLDVDRYEQISESPALFEELQQTEMSSEDQAPIVLMFLSMWYYILAHSDVVCYFMVFLNQIKSASVISLPLPMMVFLWGSLTIPRPTKTFWVTVIAYTEVIVIIKCVFQFELLPWNNNLPSQGTPFFPAKIIGIERKPNYATYDLILLLIVFFHRFMLKSLGLWKSSFEIDATLHEGEYKLEQSSLLVLTKTHEEADRDSIDQDLAFITVTGDQYLVLPTMHIVYVDRYSNRLIPLCADAIPYLLRQYKQHSVSLACQGRFNGSASKQESSMSIRTPGGHRLTSVSSAVHEENEQSEATKSAVATTSGYSGRPPDDVKDEDPDNLSLTESMGKLVIVRMEPQDEAENYPVMLNLATSRYFESARIFFSHLLDPTSRVTTDVYAYMFICDFFNFLVTFFGFSAFGSQIGDGGVSAYLKENKVPIPFLMMLILQFMLIIIDRGLYLRKFILGKVVFQYFLIFGVHIWMFFVLPGVTERPFNALLPPQMWYMVKCFYLLLSAYQIRSGYPTRILGNFLCKGYNYVNMVLFKGFMIVPFLFELRTIMDWMWTDTSMTLFDWLKMEDIFAHVFQVKCARYVEEEFPSPRGEKKPGWVKYLMGGCGLFAIVGIIWFPLVLFALGSTVGQSNLPYDVTLNIRIGPYQPIFSMSAQNNSIFRFTEKELSVMRSIYQPIREADTFLMEYEYTDIAAIKLNCYSTSIWTISPPDQIRLINEINSDRVIVIRMEYTISRLTTNKENPGVITEQLEVQLPPLVDGQPNQVRVELAQMLKENNPNLPPILIQHMLPKFIKVTNIGTAKPVPQLMLPFPTSEDQLYRNITLKLSKSETTDKSWWEMREDCSGANYDRFLRKLPYKDCDYLMMYTFNEKTFPASLSVFSGGGIIGLYTTLVFVASRVFRGIFSDIFHKIMFEDMPNIDRVLQLCLDIYLVREAKELCLEEDLFAKLVFLFRSPETMIKWTRPKEIGETDDDDPEQLDDNDRRPE